MVHRDDHIAFFVALLNIAVGIGSLFHGEAPVNNGLDISCLYHLSHLHQIFKTSRRNGADDTLVGFGCQEHLNKLLHLEAGKQVDATRL